MFIFVFLACDLWCYNMDIGQLDEGHGFGPCGPYVMLTQTLVLAGHPARYLAVQRQPYRTQCKFKFKPVPASFSLCGLAVDNTNSRFL